MTTSKGKLGIIVRFREENNNAPPPSAKPGLADMRIKSAGLADPAENRRSDLKLRVDYK